MFAVFKRKNLIIISVLVATIITFVVCFSALASIKTSKADVGKIKIVLDAGHGGVDGGVCGVKTGVKESELNLSVVKKLEQYIICAGMEPVLTRSSNAGLYGVATSNLKRKDMEKRKEIINNSGAVAVVSIHMNKYSVSTRRGAQVFFKKSDENSKMLAENVQKCFNEMDSASRSCSILSGDYYILNCSNTPSIIAECGFLSNPQDEALLITEQYQSEIAYAIFKGIVGYLTQATLFYFSHSH